MESSAELSLTDLASPAEDDEGPSFDRFKQAVREFMGFPVDSVHISQVSDMMRTLSEAIEEYRLSKAQLRKLGKCLDFTMDQNPNMDLTMEELWSMFKHCAAASASSSDFESPIASPSRVSADPKLRSSPSRIPRPTPAADRTDEPSNDSTPHTPHHPTAAARSPPSFGRKRTTPLIPATSARRAFEASKTRSNSHLPSAGGLVTDADVFDEGDAEPELITEEAFPENEASVISPLDGAAAAAAEGELVEDHTSTPLRLADLDIEDRAGTPAHSRSRNLSAFTTPLRPHDHDVFHTPMTSMAGGPATHFKVATLAAGGRASPSPHLGGSVAARSLPAVAATPGWSPAASAGSAGPASGRMTPRSLRAIFGELRNYGLSDETLRRVYRRELSQPNAALLGASDDEWDDGGSSSAASTVVEASELEQITRAAIDLARRMREQDREMMMFQRSTDAELARLRARCEEMEKEVARKKKANQTLMMDNSENRIAIEHLEQEIERLNADIRARKKESAELRIQLDNHKAWKAFEVHLTEDNDLKERQKEEAMQSLDAAERELRKSREDRERLEESMALLREQYASAISLANLLRKENNELHQTVDNMKSTLDDMSTSTTLNPLAHHGAPAAEPLRTLNLELDSAYGSHTESATDEPGLHPQKRGPARVSRGPMVVSTDRETQTMAAATRDAATTATPTPVATLEVGNQTAEELMRWRPAPVLSTAVQFVDIVPQRAPNIEAGTQTAVRRLDVGVQSGGGAETGCSVGVMTEETAEGWEEREAMARMFEEKCRELQRAVDVLEVRVEQVDTLETELASLTAATSDFRADLRAVQTTTQENRRRIALRKHFDDEMERWIGNTQQTIEEVNETVAVAKEALEVNVERQAGAAARIEELERELARYKEMVERGTAGNKSVPSSPISPDTSVELSPRTLSQRLRTIVPALRNELTAPRWAVPLFAAYSVLLWNAGSNFYMMMGFFNRLLEAGGLGGSFGGDPAAAVPSWAAGTGVFGAVHGPGTPGIDQSCTFNLFSWLEEGRDLPPPM
ncbi:hypothetical protein HDU96_006441 [Phlyctochytrium bullatum]|nr:hypothetical protein HDU96_006441 [Phlyctochytrium bullatum]